MIESLVLFDSVVNSRWFMRTSIILFLNKVDLFKQKLGRSPLAQYFPDYSGGNDVNRAAKYLLWRFNQVNRAHLNLYPHLTQATDTSNIRLVFAAVKETILQNALKDSGILWATPWVAQELQNFHFHLEYQRHHHTASATTRPNRKFVNMFRGTAHTSLLLARHTRHDTNHFMHHLAKSLTDLSVLSLKTLKRWRNGVNMLFAWSLLHSRNFFQGTLLVSCLSAFFLIPGRAIHLFGQACYCYRLTYIYPLE